MRKKLEITRITGVEVEIDESKITQEFLEQFSRTIYKVDSVEDIIKFAGYRAVEEDHSLGKHYDEFIEGLGDSKEIGLKVYYEYDETEIDLSD